MKKVRDEQSVEQKAISNEKNKNNMKKVWQEKSKFKSDLDRLVNFQKSVRFGAIFICSSCDKKMFQNNVTKLDEIVKDKLQEKNKELYNNVIRNSLEEIEVDIADSEETKRSAYLCMTCKKHLGKGKIPPMSRENGLSLVDLGNDADLVLSELENNLISRRLLFQKIYQLPRSRMAGCKDRLINIPVNQSDVINTVAQLPRTPNEAGLLEIKLKRKMEYNNFHKKEFVNPTKIFKALEFLKKNKHPSYLFFDDLKQYEERCRLTDPKGYDLVFVYDDGIEKIVDIEEYIENLPNVDKTSDKSSAMDEEDEDHLQEIDSIKNDPIRKFQFDYDKSVCMVDKFPEAAMRDDQIKESESISFAPGEGKIPENILMTEGWDIDAFPMKYPDGKNGLHQERERKLTDQYHFVQRLRNKDERFSSDPSYVFASAAYLEKKQLQRNINVSFNRGKKSVSSSGENTYSLDDGFSVFDKISNTPSYWKTAKYEMLAKLENLGPFQFFFTLSCADSRWDENFSSIMRSLGRKIRYKFDSKGSEETMVITEDNQEIKLNAYLEDHVNKSLHEIIRTNIMNATRNYNHRVKAFIKEIIMDKSNPMSVKHYSTKVEFQGRGASHNHGTLWVDLAKMEYNFEDKDGNWKKMDDLLNKKGISEKSKLQHHLKVLLSRKHQEPKNMQAQHECQVNDNELEASTDELCEVFSNTNENLDKDTLLLRFPLYGISTAFKKFQTREPLLPYEEKAMIRFADIFTT